MSEQNKTVNSPVTRVVGAIAFAWFVVFLIYGGFIAPDTFARGISAAFCGIGLTVAMTCVFWNGATSHHKGGGEDLE